MPGLLNAKAAGALLFPKKLKIYAAFLLPRHILKSLFARAAKAARTAVRLGKCSHFFDDRSKIGHDDHLCNALAGLHGIGLGAEVVQTHMDLTAVVAVDNTHAVCNVDALLNAQTAAGKDKSGCARGYLCCKSAGEHRPLAGLNGAGNLDAGTKVVACTAGCSLLGDKLLLFFAVRTAVFAIAGLFYTQIC